MRSGHFQEKVDETNPGFLSPLEYGDFGFQGVSDHNLVWNGYMREHFGKYSSTHKIVE